MPRYLIEVEHESDAVACLRAIQIFLQTGSHFLTNADWGCMDGEHRCWMVIEAESKEEARFFLPPAFRPQARLIRLDKFRLEEVNEMLDQHSA